MSSNCCRSVLFTGELARELSISLSIKSFMLSEENLCSKCLPVLLAFRFATVRHRLSVNEEEFFSPFLDGLSYFRCFVVR